MTVSPGATVLLIACGALAREITALKRLGGWDHVTLRCLPAALHNRPDEIPRAVARLLESARDEFTEILVAYADCGTGGRLDAVLAEHGAHRLPGAHCYEVFAGAESFASLQEAEPGTFYLTDFLVRHFDRLVIRGLGIDRHPELQPLYFGNYRRVVHLAQSRSPELAMRARVCAKRLGLEFEQRVTGMDRLERALGVGPAPAATSEERGG
jgi:hypothetical protein